VTLPAPLLSCLYIAFCLYGPAAVGQFMRVSLYSLLLLCFFVNSRIGKSLGELHAREANAFCQDIAKGLDVRQLAVAHWWSFYSPPDAFEAHLESLRKVGFGPMAHARPASNDRHYPMFKTRPMLVSSPECAILKVGDDTVLAVPTECSLHFSLHRDKQVVDGKLGILPATDADPGAVRFTVELRMLSAPKQILFERVLDPAEQEADRGFQDFSTPIPDGAEGEIILRTTFVGAGGAARPRCFWTHVGIR
ncbi:MAG TPA: hypothetical protein VM509_11690, partial [Planctomycetota bacterium]|nr:hypothetical protein [Planctomycetota bacterium]